MRNNFNPSFLLYLNKTYINDNAGAEKDYSFSKNLQSTQLRPEEITKKTADDLVLGRIREVFPKASDPFICSPLRLVPKTSNKFRSIHHLSYPPVTSVNDFIDSSEAAYFRNHKDAFRLTGIPNAPQHQWLIGLQWEGRFY